MSFPVFDLHCDTALAMVHYLSKGQGDLRSNPGHIDLTRAKRLPGYAQCFAVYTSTWEKAGRGGAQEMFSKELEAITSQIEKNSDMIGFAKSAKEVLENREKGLFSGILTIEGAAGIGFDPEKLEEVHKIGFRMTSLGWNEKNPLTGSHVTGGGLTDLGRVYVRQAQRLGMMVDVSHISDEGFWDILNITEAPIVASHSNSRAVWDVSRNLTDDMFRAICESGGVAGFNQYSGFVGEKPTLDTACDHVLHFLELDPDGDHIALGGDLDGCEELPQGFDGVDSYPAFAQRLLQRGLDKPLVEKIFWKNALGVMERCCM